MRERPRKFGLELHPAKTRLIEFVRYAAERRNKRGKRKPETFQFLGFTHIGGTNHRTGHFTLHRNTIGKPMAEKLKDIEGKLRRRMHGSVRGALGNRRPYRDRSRYWCRLLWPVVRCPP